MLTISFEVPGTPQSKLRHRIMGMKIGKRVRARAYNPKENEINEAWIGSVAREHAPKEIPLCPVMLELMFAFPIPESKPKWWKFGARGQLINMLTKPDIDNLVKLVMDALTRCGYWKDDAQIYALSARKIYSANPTTQVVIVYRDVPDPASIKFQMKMFQTLP